MVRVWIFASVLVGVVWADTARAQTPAEREVRDLERRVKQLERRVQTAESDVRTTGSAGGVFLLFGVFCALWAQNTGRNPWLWFLLGLLFNVITTVFLLSKNADDRRQREAANTAHA